MRKILMAFRLAPGRKNPTAYQLKVGVPRILQLALFPETRRPPIRRINFLFDF